MFYMQLSAEDMVVLDLLRKRIPESQSCFWKRLSLSPRRTNS